MPPSGVSRASYWDDLYRHGQDGWEKGCPAPPILGLARTLKRGRVAVLGCGRGHEARALARMGWEAVGFDFSPRAIRSARRLGGARFEQADLFDLPGLHPGAFDAVCEHTCFCAIDPGRRGEYVRAASVILKPGGAYFGLFYAHGKPGGPPFDVTAAEIRRLFSRRFRIARLGIPADSHSGREGKELLGLFYLRRRRQRR